MPLVMNSFKTKAGTIIPFLNLKGKDYIQVMHRVLWFREEHPKAKITCEFIKLEDSYAIAKASITTDDGDTLGVAHGREDAKHFPDFIEKAETKAIGRALALSGYGTQFAPELDEGERIVDSPVPIKVKTAEIPKPISKYQTYKEFKPLPDERDLKSQSPKSRKEADFNITALGPHYGKLASSFTDKELNSMLVDMRAKVKVENREPTDKEKEFSKKVQIYLSVLDPAHPFGDLPT